MLIKVHALSTTLFLPQYPKVMKMEGAAHNPIATVKFEHNGEKKIMLNYAKLRIVE